MLQWFMEACVRALSAKATVVPRGRQRAPGKHKPAGSKLARMAAEHRCAKGQPR